MRKRKRVNKIKPIIFSTQMVQAILDGRKSQTRRVVNPQPGAETNGQGYYFHRFKKTEHKRMYSPTEFCEKALEHAKYKIGDILYVKETFSPIYDHCDPTIAKVGAYQYRACVESDATKWRPSIHMPREAARLFLRVTGVRVERLQEISETDARAEGFIATVRHKTVNGKLYNGSTTAREEFIQLWDSLNTKRGYGWDSNCWVWVYEFETVCEEELL